MKIWWLNLKYVFFNERIILKLFFMSVLECFSMSCLPKYICILWKIHIHAIKDILTVILKKNYTLKYTFLEAINCQWKFDSCSFRINLMMAGRILNIRLNLVNNFVNKSSSIIDILFHFHKYIHLQTDISVIINEKYI